MSLSGVLFLIVQFVVLALGCMASLRSARSSLYLFNPYVWFTFFIFFWFLVPQILAIFPPHLIVGLEAEGQYYREIMLPYGQVGVLVYIVAVTLGFFVGSSLINFSSHFSDFTLDLNRFDYFILLNFYVFGVACIFYLGMQFQGLDGMRSELVKTTSGKIATAVSFYGNFAFAVLFSISLIKKKYTYTFLLLTIFASAILLTGARGRLMWPLLISFIFIAIYFDSIPLKKIFLLGFVFVVVLSLLDPLMISIRTGDFSRLVDELDPMAMVESIFYRRNFDSFSNLTVILYFDEVEFSLSRLVTGARDAFMYSYYPEIYESGVGFGVSYPGSLYLAAGWFGVVIGGVLFGTVLGVISKCLVLIRDFKVLFGYLFLMPWLAAVGGNFIESVDKMIVAISPVLFWLYVRRLSISGGRYAQ